MPALVAGIHVFADFQRCKDVDGRDKPGHDVFARWFNMIGMISRVCGRGYNVFL